MTTRNTQYVNSCRSDLLQAGWGYLSGITATGIRLSGCDTPGCFDNCNHNVTFYHRPLVFLFQFDIDGHFALSQSSVCVCVFGQPRSALLPSGQPIKRYELMSAQYYQERDDVAQK